MGEAEASIKLFLHTLQAGLLHLIIVFPRTPKSSPRGSTLSSVLISAVTGSLSLITCRKFSKVFHAGRSQALFALWLTQLLPPSRRFPLPESHALTDIISWSTIWDALYP